VNLGQTRISSSAWLSGASESRAHANLGQMNLGHLQISGVRQALQLA
jgi:hypothetical protein